MPLLGIRNAKNDFMKLEIEIVGVWCLNSGVCCLNSFSYRAIEPWGPFHKT